MHRLRSEAGARIAAQRSSIITSWTGSGSKGELLWAQEPLVLAMLAAFRGFEWTCLRGAAESWFFGIGQMVDPAAFSEAEGFETLSTQHAARIRADRAVEYYLIAGLIRASATRRVCVLEPPEK
jgi:hypothetical protein